MAIYGTSIGCPPAPNGGGPLLTPSVPAGDAVVRLHRFLGLGWGFGVRFQTRKGLGSHIPDLYIFCVCICIGLRRELDVGSLRGDGPLNLHEWQGGIEYRA